MEIENVGAESHAGEMTENEKRANVIRLAFGGDDDLFNEFCEWIRVAVPDGTTAVHRSGVHPSGKDSPIGQTALVGTNPTESDATAQT